MSNYSAIGMLAILLIFLVGFIICIFRRRYMLQRARHDEQYFSDDVDHYLAREPFAVVAAAQDGRLAGDGGRGSSRAGPAAEGVVLPNTLYHPAVLTGRVLSGVNTNTNTNNNTSTYATAAITGISGYYGNPLQSNLPVALPAFVDETGQPVLHHLSSEDEADRTNNNVSGARTAGGGQGGSGVYGEAYYLPRPAEAKEDYTVLVDDTDEKDEEDEEEDKVKRKEEEHKTGADAAKGTAETTSEQTAGVVDRTASEGTMQVAPHETKGQLQCKGSKGNKDS